MADIISTKVINNNIMVLNDYIIRGRPQTTLSASADAAATTISVFSIEGFSEGNFYALIGYGSGNAELIKMHASTAPSGTTITLAAALANNHDANEPVNFVNFNQIEYSLATTATGTKTVLSTDSIMETKKWSIYCDATNSTGYAFVRFKNSDATTYSGYSAPAPYANAAFNTCEYIINEALIETKQTFTDSLTPSYCLKQIDECLRDIRKNKNKLSWSQSFNAILGQTAEGVFRYSMPTDIYDKYSIKAIERLSLGGEPALNFADPNYFFNQLMTDVHFTQVTTDASLGDITLEINNSYDFDDDGSVNVGGENVTYTGITRSATAGILTGVPASGTGAIPTAGISADDWVFQGETNSEPKYWTAYNGYIYIYPLVDDTWDNFNVNIDYFKTITSVDSLEDAVDYIQFDLIKYWLKWKIKAIEKNDGILDLNDADYLLYRDSLATLIKKDRNLNIKTFRNAYEFGETDTSGHNPKRLRDGNALKL